MANRIKDITGVRFTRLVAIRCVGSNGTDALWECKCDCGAVKTITACNLKSGGTKSCGCLRRQNRNKRLNSGITQFDKKKTPEFRSWQSMMQRCYNPNARGYHNYGGRGIDVCTKWHSFVPFLIDMGYRPSLRYCIERVNNDIGYSEDNCVWATRKQQAYNRRSNVMVSIEEETRCLAEWAEIIGINPQTVGTRIFKGMSPHEALTADRRKLWK